ncbi:MAG: DUF2442 domain-containing protein [Clostridia bacterium]
MYMTPKLIRAKALENYKIELLYETGELKIYDMTELLNTCEFYKKLKDEEKFKKIAILGLSIQWQSGEDIAPEILYNDSVLQKLEK